VYEGRAADFRVSVGSMLLFLRNSRASSSKANGTDSASIEVDGAAKIAQQIDLWLRLPGTVPMVICAAGVVSAI